MENIDKIIKKYLEKELNNTSLINMYYEIGKYISLNNIDTKKLEIYLKSKYGVVIAFTERNLKNMLKFSRYSDEDLKKLEKITWKNILVILKHDDSLIDVCLKYRPTKKQLLNYIKADKILVENEKVEEDETLMELIRLKKELSL